MCAVGCGGLVGGEVLRVFLDGVGRVIGRASSPLDSCYPVYLGLRPRL
jgi:hypothetical protein